MLNIEKYKDVLILFDIIKPSQLAKVKVRDKDKLVPCDWVDCVDCEYYKDSKCSIKAEEWLFQEYEEPKVDWSKVKVDTPILVGNTENDVTHKRYFAKYEDGKVYTWGGGTTSWTVSGEHDVTFWKYAKLAESEE